MTYDKWKQRYKFNNGIWHNRGYLPHLNKSESTQFVTFRLADSLPLEVLENMKLDGDYLTSDAKREKVLQLLDNGYGECHLKNPLVAELIVSSIKYFNISRYTLHEYVIMPNHVHLLITPNKDILLAKIIASLKSYTSNEANKILNRIGTFWYRDYFDRYIRDEDHYSKVSEYILNNPVSAGLCSCKEDWPYSSLRWK
jgi:REP element-mobilizing transposase RayT